LDPRRRKWWEAEEDSITMSFITLTLHQISLGRSSQGGGDGQDMKHAQER